MARRINRQVFRCARPHRDVQVIYDARGNISYKSDVGQYWYDAARPNRMTNITLSQPAGAKLLTGKRILTYAFDDYRAGAQAMNGTTVGNGNLWYTVSQDASLNRHTVRWETYTSFNMPHRILFGALVDPSNPVTSSTVADRTLTFVYGPEHQRIKQKVELAAGQPSSMQAGSTWYLNGEDSQGLSYEKTLLTNGVTENKHFLSAGGMVFALQVTRSTTAGTSTTAATATLSYFHHDHLGSIAAVSNAAGVVTEQLAYDPWGRRRFPSGLPDTLDSVAGVATDRGYTMHEHLDEMGVIHMNGRVFDPLIGRFMSADPFIQAPGNLQSYNRYSYVMNNPLAFTDPSGYWSLKRAWKKVWHNKVARFLISAAVGYFTGQWIGEAFKLGGFAAGGGGTAFATGGFQLTTLGGAVAGAGGGFAAGLVGSGGDLKAAAQGALTGGLFGAIGATGAAEGWGSGQFIAAHAAAGCVSAAAGGGNCAAGAASGAFGKWATIQTEGWGVGVAQFTATTVAGGIGSVIGGGKFANGAETAAFGYLFNNCSSIACFDDLKGWAAENWDRYLAWRQQGADRWMAAAYGDAAASQQIGYDLAMGFSGSTAGGASSRIAGGHAMSKHVLGVGAKADDPLFKGLGIRTVAQLEAHTTNVMANATVTKALDRGRTAYWHEATSTVVIHNPRHPDLGSIFQPTRGRAYFDNLK